MAAAGKRFSYTGSVKAAAGKRFSYTGSVKAAAAFLQFCRPADVIIWR